MNLKGSGRDRNCVFLPNIEIAPNKSFKNHDSITVIKNTFLTTDLLVSK